MMTLISAKDAAKKWGISQKKVVQLCEKGRIENAIRQDNIWTIPSNTQKPLEEKNKKSSRKEDRYPKPFLKWAGGKGQLLKEIEKYYPFDDYIVKYAEPFVGGGAVLFDILSKYDLRNVYISDVNNELINTYSIIKNDVSNLITFLKKYQEEFIPLDSSQRKIYYLRMRELFNTLKTSPNSINATERASLMIFLNKTCFNGLYRVNSKGLFNVPMGTYKNPLICDEENLRSVSEKLQNVTIVCGDYHQSKEFIDDHTFAYFDPPYRPLSNTSNFTAYNEASFDDTAQIELATFIDEISKRRAKIVVSNSDPKNSRPDDNFFDDIYKNHNIKRVEASRMINCNSDSRGKIKELIISNYQTD